MIEVVVWQQRRVSARGQPVSRGIVARASTGSRTSTFDFGEPIASTTSTTHTDRCCPSRISARGLFFESCVGTAAARDQIQAVDGVTSAAVTTGVDRQTLKTTHFVDVCQQVDGTANSRDLSQLIGYAARVAWATDVGGEPADVQVAGSTHSSVDPSATPQKFGMEASPASMDLSSALVSARILEEKWGRWPGSVSERLG